MFTVDTPITLSNSIIGFTMVYRPTNITGGHLLAGAKVWQWNKRDCEKKRPKHMSRGDPGADPGGDPGVHRFFVLEHIMAMGCN